MPFVDREQSERQWEFQVSILSEKVLIVIQYGTG